MIKYLSLEGLQTLVTKCKSYFVPQTRTVNSKALNSDIVLDGSDISVTIGDMSEVLNTALTSVNSSLSSKADLVDGVVPSSQLPSYIDDVLEFGGTVSDITITSGSATSPTAIVYNETTHKFVAQVGDFNATYYSDWSTTDNVGASTSWGTGNDIGIAPQQGKIYVDTSTNKTYRWGGSSLIEISSCDLTTAEKSWIEDQLFDSLFTCTISASPSSGVYSGTDSTVTYTLTTKYDGTLVDLDETPSGWTKSSTGTYTKTATVRNSTSASINSGSVTCTYNYKSKTASAAYYTNTKYSYMYYSQNESISALDDVLADPSIVQLSTSNNISGSKTLDISGNDLYVYFIIANTSKLNNVQQLGLDYLQDKTGTTLTSDALGTFTVYRSANAMSEGTQTVTIL